MDAEVEEMTRDRRNNILIHGLPVQVRTRLSPGDIRITLTFSLIVKYNKELRLMSFLLPFTWS